MKQTLPVIACLLFTTPLHPLPSGDVRIKVITVADLKGNYLPDKNGVGGIAALKSYFDETRKELESEGGDALLLHAGDFTGEKSAGAIGKKIAPGNIDLIRYMPFRAVQFSARERQAIRKQKKLRSTLPSGSNGGKGKPFSMKGLEFLIDDLPNTHQKLDNMYEQNPGVALSILFATPKTADLHLPHTAPMNASPFPEKESGAVKSLILFPSGRNLFYRTDEGFYVCEVAATWICEVEFTFRASHILSVAYRAYKINADEFPHSFIEPDATLLDTLLKKGNAGTTSPKK